VSPTDHGFDGAWLDHAEALHVPERMIVAPATGVFRAHDVVCVGAAVGVGDAVGHVEGPGTRTPVASPFDGCIAGMLAAPGERLREGQPVAWLRTA
jgi:biotin carboxyl carrier protein